MESWIFLVLVSQIIWAFCSIIDKFIISKGHIRNPMVYIVLNGAMNVLLVFLLPFIHLSRISAVTFFIALLSSATVAAAIIIYYKAVQYDEISKVVMLYLLAPIAVLVLSYLFLEEVLTKNHFIGFLFLLGAGIIVSYKKVENAFKLSKAFYYMLISAFFSAIALVSGKHIFNVTSFWNAFLWLRLTAVSAVVVLIAPSIRNQFAQTFREMKNNIKGLLTLKIIIDFSAFIFSGYAIFNGPISLVTVLASSVAPLFVFIVALFTTIYFPKLVKEEINKKAILTKLLAIALIIIGIVFINL